MKRYNRSREVGETTEFPDLLYSLFSITSSAMLGKRAKWSDVQMLKPQMSRRLQDPPSRKALATRKSMNQSKLSFPINTFI